MIIQQSTLETTKYPKGYFQTDLNKNQIYFSIFNLEIYNASGTACKDVFFFCFFFNSSSEEVVMTQNRCGALTQYISLNHLLYQSLRGLFALFSIIMLDFK